MENIRIQDDLYNYVNQEWLEKAVIPDDKPTAGGFADLNKAVEELMIKEFLEISSKKKYANKHIENACKLFRIVRNTEKRDSDGIAPVLPVLGKIEALKDVNDLSNHLQEMIEEGMKLPFKVSVDDDMKDTAHYCVMLYGPDIILPDTVYYQEPMAAQKKVIIGFFTDMIKPIMAMTGLSKKKQAQYIKDALAFDEILATLVKSREEWSEYTKCYNPMTVSTVNSLLRPLNFKGCVSSLFGDDVKKVIVAEPRYFKNFKTVLNDETFELYKHWAYIWQLYGACDYLSEELRELGSSYSLKLTGVTSIPELDKYAYQLASSVFSEPVGIYYGEKYFGEAAKRDVTEMVQEIVEIYKKRIAKNDFLSEATKEKAILKLSKMGLKMAYPDKVEEIYELMDVDEASSLYDNICRLNKIRRLDRFAKIRKEVDHTKWVMPGHMVNACYNPTFNDITFPAAILQAPFYSIKQSRSSNLGGIGAVIAHEISHAFDNNGAKCDENGNLNNWWTAEDRRKFNARTKAMVKEFEGIELPWGPVNSKLIVSENIADNGGMAATLEVMASTANADYKEYFENWARIWCMKAKPEYLQLLLSIDVHAPNILRANMQPRNFDEWYETYDVKKTDKMYIAPSKRVHIW